MKVNVAGIRFIADVIEQNAHLYNQSKWGKSLCESDIAGTGISCGTPACVAGFTVQYLGNSEEYRKWILRDIPKGMGVDAILTGYAAHLLGLDDEWANQIFMDERWPLHWIYEPDHPAWSFNSGGYQKTLMHKFGGKRLHCYRKIYVSESIGTEYEPMHEPTPEQAVAFLRRLADQFEADQGVNANAHKPVEVEVYDTSVDYQWIGNYWQF